MFDKEKFAALLIRAQGDRSLNEYARQTGISSAHISRLSRALLDAPPNPQTIKQLADQAHNGVTYDEMMVVAGHLTPDWLPSYSRLDTGKIPHTARYDISSITDEEAELISFIRRSWSKLTPEQRKKKLELAKISLRIIDEVERSEKKDKE
ncbi:hypothetical protein EDC14_1001164 [Hydrogenispora ethanolica]|jgi:transcriptional regulator with XRE-family HTH domain|uniref:Helix-turn-helix protein n=1 Tax=Hydrogenispora ethanolica TaxID=1082276 RepID=A0A4R1SBT0_HYDET|nr:DNA-binding protein [Hydrogenispora ethanolica]TCL76879.1 hypothetical protein EDC14_1001164 [Hydrogenispora ethanolica]